MRIQKVYSPQPEFLQQVGSKHYTMIESVVAGLGFDVLLTMMEDKRYSVHNVADVFGLNRVAFRKAVRQVNAKVECIRIDGKRQLFISLEDTLQALYDFRENMHVAAFFISCTYEVVMRREDLVSEAWCRGVMAECSKYQKPNRAIRSRVAVH